MLSLVQAFIHSSSSVTPATNHRDRLEASVASNNNNATAHVSISLFDIIYRTKLNKMWGSPPNDRVCEIMCVWFVLFCFVLSCILWSVCNSVDVDIASCQGADYNTLCVLQFVHLNSDNMFYSVEHHFSFFPCISFFKLLYHIAN